jgi:3-oxoacyl-[acyl-carrier protein] reductase
MAWQLAECGAEVTLMARNQEKLEKVRNELPSHLGQHHGLLVVDFMDFPNFQDKLTAFFEDNSIDILVNNTNGPEAGSVSEKKITDYQQAFDLLFKTYCSTAILALEGMKSKQFGRIINVSSVSVKEPLQNLVLSNTIRSAVISWAKTLAMDMAPYGITVNNILTGSFDTERLRDLHRKQAENKGIDLEEWRKHMAEKIPLKRFGQPKEYGYLATFLASEYSSYITGTNIPIDGGALRSV